MIFGCSWRTASLICAALLLTGCVPQIEVLPSATATPVPVATAAPEQHALSIIGVDFDPPLDTLRSLPDGITLMAVIANNGLSWESNVRVSAQLLDPAAGDRELTAETVVLYSLQAGEVRVVRFTQVSDLPILSSYRLLVKVEPVPGESNTADNVHSYDIVMRSGR